MNFCRISCFLLMSFSFLSHAKNVDFHLVTENFPPLNMTNNGTSYARNDRVTGLATDIIRQLFDKSGYSISLTLKNSWDEAFGKARDTPGYGIYSTFRTPIREDKFQWVGPLYDEEWVILALQDSNVDIKSVADLQSHKVGSYAADPFTDLLREKQVDVLAAQSDAVNAVKLKVGLIELWASGSLAGPYTAANLHVPVKQVYVVDETSLWLAMHINTDPAVVAKLNWNLKKMHESGEVQRVIDSYMHQ